MFSHIHFRFTPLPHGKIMLITFLLFLLLWAVEAAFWIALYVIILIAKIIAYPFRRIIFKAGKHSANDNE